MKKSLWVVVFMLLSASVSAQMLETLGGLGVQGAMTAEGVQQMGSVQQKTRILALFRAIELKNAELITTYFGDYSGMPITRITQNNVVGVYRPVEAGKAFEVSFQQLSKAVCSRLIERGWERLTHIWINGKSYLPGELGNMAFEYCQDKNNIRLIFQ